MFPLQAPWVCDPCRWRSKVPNGAFCLTRRGRNRLTLLAVHSAEPCAHWLRPPASTDRRHQQQQAWHATDAGSTRSHLQALCPAVHAASYHVQLVVQSCSCSHSQSTHGGKLVLGQSLWLTLPGCWCLQVAVVGPILCSIDRCGLSWDCMTQTRGAPAERLRAPRPASGGALRCRTAPAAPQSTPCQKPRASRHPAASLPQRSAQCPPCMPACCMYVFLWV